jgi:hypothetical protein
LDYTSLVFGGGQFILYGYQNREFTSVNGTTWEQHASDATLSIASTIFVNNVFLAGCYQGAYGSSYGVILSSSDGLYWWKHCPYQGPGIESFCRHDDKIVGVGPHGMVVTSDVDPDFRNAAFQGKRSNHGQGAVKIRSANGC